LSYERKGTDGGFWGGGGVMSYLPKGWVFSNLGNLANYTNGKAFKPSEWQESGLPIIRIQNLNDETIRFNRTTKAIEEKYKVKSGDLLIAWSASLGAYIWKRGDAWLNQHIFRADHFPYVCDKQFLKYAIDNSISKFYDKAHGSGMVHVTKGVFESHKIPLPPLNEQKRIADKLDQTLAIVERAKARLSCVPKINNFAKASSPPPPTGG
jgi:type I restriction enzyme S subunit